MKKISLILIFVSLGSVFPGFCADEPPQTEQGVRANGIVFNIAKDRRIEKVGGIYEPEGIDKYVERKINEVSERIQGLESQLEIALKKLDELNQKISAANASQPRDLKAEPIQ